LDSRGWSTSHRHTPCTDFGTPILLLVVRAGAREREVVARRRDVGRAASQEAGGADEAVVHERAECRRRGTVTSGLVFPSQRRRHKHITRSRSLRPANHIHIGAGAWAAHITLTATDFGTDSTDFGPAEGPCPKSVHGNIDGTRRYGWYS
jgi:hypothetical protein